MIFNRNKGIKLTFSVSPRVVKAKISITTTCRRNHIPISSGLKGETIHCIGMLERIQQLFP